MTADLIAFAAAVLAPCVFGIIMLVFFPDKLL